MIEPVLSVRKLQVEFATRRSVLRAIDGISFDIARGEEVLGICNIGGGGQRGHRADRYHVSQV